MTSDKSMNNQITPINKGNYSLDTTRREKRFEKIRGYGWEKEYLQYRMNWSKYPKKRIISNYPLLVDIELSSLCNLHCPMCYTITDEFKKKVNTKFIDFDLFKKIIDEIGPYVPALRLSLRGEPTLHPKFIECIEYAKEKGIKEVSFLTNGSKLYGRYFEKVLKAGADWITISIDGTGDTYERIRRPLKFDKIFKMIKQINDIKTSQNSDKPVVKAQTIWPAIKDDPQRYYNMLKPYIDLIAFNPLIDYLSVDKDIVYVDNFICPQHYQRIVVGADGLAMMCSNDEENTVVVGDANIESIFSVWHGKELNRIREIQLEKEGFKKIPVCLKCYLPRKTIDAERKIVNGREIIVKNYINRTQEIGQ
jgi:MoaA/NifB/PqqE/SkfB family radical SAM enzyme